MWRNKDRRCKTTPYLKISLSTGVYGICSVRAWTESPLELYTRKDMPERNELCWSPYSSSLRALAIGASQSGHQYRWWLTWLLLAASCPRKSSRATATAAGYHHIFFSQSKRPQLISSGTRKLDRVSPWEQVQERSMAHVSLTCAYGPKMLFDVAVVCSAKSARCLDRTRRQAGSIA